MERLERVHATVPHEAVEVLLKLLLALGDKVTMHGSEQLLLRELRVERGHLGGDGLVELVELLEALLDRP